MAGWVVTFLLYVLIETFNFTILHLNCTDGTAGWAVTHMTKLPDSTLSNLIMTQHNLPNCFRTYGRLSPHLLFQLAVAVHQLLLTERCSTPSRLHLSKHALCSIASVLSLRALFHFKVKAALGILKIVPGTNETSLEFSTCLPQTTFLCWQMLQLLLGCSVSSK